MVEKYIVQAAVKELSIQEVVNLSILQRIQDTFAKAMGVGAVTVDRNGQPVTRESNFQPLCMLIRSTQKGLARCMACDANGSLKSYKEGEPQTYLCYGGLMDVAAPIIIEGEYLGGFLCGQVVLAENRDKFIEGIVERNVPLGFNSKELRAVAEAIPAIPRERLDAAVEMLFVMTNHIIEMGVANLSKTKLLSEIKEKAKLQEALQNAQLRALEAQVNPHFLFNALTLVGYTAIAEDAPQTEEIAYNLSDLLRYSLRNVARAVPLSEEMEMIERYLAIQKLRFGSRLQAQISIAPGLSSIHIPCMTLQPLVENAVIHALEPLTRPVQIDIRAEQHQNNLRLTIQDDGLGMEPDMVAAIKARNFPEKNGSTSIGLQNVIRRLMIEYDQEFSFQISSQPNQGTRIDLLVPLKLKTSRAAQIAF